MTWRAVVTVALLGAVATATSAQDVSLAGRMGDKALLVVQGRSLVLGVGQASGGTKLLRANGRLISLNLLSYIYRNKRKSSRSIAK